MQASKRAKLLRLLAILAALTLVFAVAACGDDEDEGGGNGGEAAQEPSGDGGGELTPVDFMLPYQDSISFIGILVAKDGCFEEEGLDVTTLPSEGSDYVVQQLIAGNVKFGQTGAQNILIANAQGRPVRGIAQIGGRGIFSIVAPTDSDVKSVEDLRGKALGVTDLGGGEMPLVRAAIDDAGLVENEDVEIKVVGPGGPAAFQAINSGEIAAYAGANNDMAGMSAEGLEYTNILDQKWQEIPTTETAVMEETLQNPEDREIAIKISRCYRKGSEFAVANPQDALDIACEQVPEECEDPKVAQAFLDAVLEGYEVPEGAESYVEHLPKEGYELIQTSLAAEEITEPQDLSVVFPDEYMDEILAD